MNTLRNTPYYLTAAFVLTLAAIALLPLHIARGVKRINELRRALK